jgi:hypothetical protein
VGKSAPTCNPDNLELLVGKSAPTCKSNHEPHTKSQEELGGKDTICSSVNLQNHVNDRPMKALCFPMYLICPLWHFGSSSSLITSFSKWLEGYRIFVIFLGQAYHQSRIFGG